MKYSSDSDFGERPLALSPSRLRVRGFHTIANRSPLAAESMRSMSLPAAVARTSTWPRL